MVDVVQFWDKIVLKYVWDLIKDMEFYELILNKICGYLWVDYEVLEIGVGIGLIVFMLVGNCVYIMVMDLFEKMFEVGCEKVWNDGIGNILFDVCCVEDMFEGLFDVVLVYNILYLVEDLSGVFQCVYVVLKSGGVIILKIFVKLKFGLYLMYWIMKLVLFVMQFFGKVFFVVFYICVVFEVVFFDVGFEIVESGYFFVG